MDAKRLVKVQQVPEQAPASRTRADLGLTLEPVGGCRSMTCSKAARKPVCHQPRRTGRSRRAERQAAVRFRPHRTRIRANQGHSRRDRSATRTCRAARGPCTTAPGPDSVAAILRDGLKKMPATTSTFRRTSKQPAVLVAARRGRLVFSSMRPDGPRRLHVLPLRQQRLACGRRPAGVPSLLPSLPRGKTMNRPHAPPRRTASNAARGRRRQVRAAVPADLHANTGGAGAQRRGVPLDARGPPALRLHVRRAGLQPRPQPEGVDAALSEVHGLAACRCRSGQKAPPGGYFPAMPMTAYNAVTPVETEASEAARAPCDRRPAADGWSR